MTRELLTEVLGEDVFVEIDIPITNIVHIVGVDKDSIINIYELAHKCKEWAFNNDYEIETTYSGDVRIFKYSDSTIVNSQLGLEDCTEPEAIFKATQWILEQI